MQIVFQPFGHIQIQVVGRFIQYQEVGFIDQYIGQGHTFQLATRQLSDSLIEIPNFELGKDLFYNNIKMKNIEESIRIVIKWGIMKELEQSDDLLNVSNE